MKVIRFCKITTAILLTTASLASSGYGDSMTVSETWRDTSDRAGNVTSTDAGTVNVSLTIPGLSGITANDWSNLLVTVNLTPTYQTAYFFDTMSDAPNFGGTVSSTTATFFFQGTDTNGNLVNVEKITFARSGNIFTISDQLINPPAVQPPRYFLAGNYLFDGVDPENGAFTDSQTYEVILQDNLDSGSTLNADVSRTLNITGTNTVTFDAFDNSLNNLRLSGAADLTPPTLTAVSPAGPLTTTNDLLTVMVKATDSTGVSNVEFYVNGLDYGSGVATVSNLWFMNFALMSATNVIKTVATGISGNNSTPNILPVTYANKQTNPNLVTVSEHWLDSAQTNGDGSLFDASQDVGTLNAAWAFPGLQSMPANIWSNLVLVLSFGDIEFSNSLASAEILTATNAIFYLDTIDDPSGNLLIESQISVARSGNTLVLASETGNPTYDFNFPIIADNYLGEGGLFQEAQPFGLMLLDGTTLNPYTNILRTVYITGVDGVSFDSQSNELDSVHLFGAADFAAPTNQIVAPVPGQHWSNAVFTVTGKSGDNVAVAGVFYSLNHSGWSNAAPVNNWSNWTAQVTLVPGTNTIMAYAVDSSGNVSATNTVNFVYILSAVLTVNINGGGTVVTNYNGELLQIGQTYSITARTNAGFGFTGWTGSIATNKPTLTFVMASNLVFTANFADTARPTNAIIAPLANQHWSNAVFTVTGRAGDNVAVANVFFSLNHNAWSNAVPVNNWSNWTAQATLTPGTNTLSAYAVDTSGNVSTTNTVSFVYVLSAVLTVHVSPGPGGTLNNNYNGALLQLGQTYSMTAKTNAGFAFSGWTGSIVTNSPTLSFVMASNLVFTASFTDIARPGLIVSAPANGQRMTNAVAFVKGTAGDNWGVAGVWFQLNSNSWSLASTTNAYTNWTATLALVAGTNTIKACAQDLGGNYSATNNLSVVSSNSFLLQFYFASATPLAGNGLTFNLLVSKNLNGHIQISTNLTTWANLTNFVGSNSSLTIHDPAATNSARRFYRAVIP
jgi:hypothetical protein